MNSGKRFERNFKRYAERTGAFVLRIPDRVNIRNGRVYSEQSEADFIVVADGGTYLVECKATSAKSLAFERVQEHQERYLSTFDNAADGAHGVLAVEFYEPDSYRNRRTFLLPISAWMDYKANTQRKSMPMCEFEKHGKELL